MPNRQQDRKPEELDADAESASLMYVRCVVCGEWLDVKPGQLNWVSHGLCSRCQVSEMARIRQILEERRRQRPPLE